MRCTAYFVHPIALQTLIGVPLPCICINTSQTKATEGNPRERSEFYSFKHETGTCDCHSLERRLFYNAEGAPDGPVLNEKKELNKENVLVATHRICKTIRIFLLNLINIGVRDKVRAR
jgi:hypothetical protein